MFCQQCGSHLQDEFSYCPHCGLSVEKDVPSNPKLSRCIMQKANSLGKALSFSQYRKKKGTSWKSRVTETTTKKCQEEEVAIGIKLLEWSVKEEKLKIRRGQKISLRISNQAPYCDIRDQAQKKWSVWQSDLYSEGEDYLLLFENGKSAQFIPGTTEFFTLKRYRDELGKDYKNICLYLCLDEDYRVANGEYLKESEEEYEPVHKQTKIEHFVDMENSFEGNTSKCQSSVLVVKDLDVDGGQDVEKREDSERVKQIKADEALAKKMQMELNEKGNFENPTAVVRELEKRVSDENQFFITVRRGTALQRILNLWRHETKKTEPRYVLRVKFLGEDGIDSGALAREFLTEVVTTIGDTLFPDGSPLDSTFHVQNGNFRTSGEIVATSLAQGGPAPTFLHECAFRTLVDADINVLNLNPEQDLTNSEKQLLEGIKSDLSQHSDTIVEHGYTGPIDEAHMDDIIRSIVVSMVNKRILYLKEFKEGLNLHGLSQILSNNPDVCKPLFVCEQQEKVDSSYLFGLLCPEFSPQQSSKRVVEEELMDNFQDLLVALEDKQCTIDPSLVASNEECKMIKMKDNLSEDQSVEQIEGQPDLSPAGIMGWLTGQKHRQLNREKIEILVKFDHNCLLRNPAHKLCFPLVSACGKHITFPVSHMKGYEDFKDVFLLAFCRGQAFGKP